MRAQSRSIRLGSLRNTLEYGNRTEARYQYHYRSSVIYAGRAVAQQDSATVRPRKQFYTTFLEQLLTMNYIGNLQGHDQSECLL